MHYQSINLFICSFIYFFVFFSTIDRKVPVLPDNKQLRVYISVYN